MSYDLTKAIDRAKLSLDGLSVGDAFGERFFSQRARQWLDERETPPGEWRYTDDTVMAMGIVEVLEECGEVEPDRLAEVFARNYTREPNRGYGIGAHRILEKISDGADWRLASGTAFDGDGSFGNGGGMRAAPVGGFFAGDPDAIVENAGASARVTHAHEEGQAGAIAVALAAGAAFETREEPAEQAAEAIFEAVCSHMPDGKVRDGVERARVMGLDAAVDDVASELGNGSQVTAIDTVPFVIWSACAHLEDYQNALWETVAAGGDRDTTCAMVGGIIALRLGRDAIPDDWLDSRESLDRFL